ncbi:MAG: sigma-70 family RNA polymerase sigma factor [PVC group bacterium]
MNQEALTVSDSVLVARFQFDGETEAFNILHRRYRTRILNYLYRYLRNYHRAEELTQETFIRVYRNLPGFKMTGKVSSWIYTIATNLARMEVRKKKLGEVSSSGLFTKEGEEINLLDSIPNHTKRPDRVAQAREIEMRVQKTIAAMPEKYREVFILCAIQGLSHEEAATTLHLRMGTAWSRLHRARKIFARELGINPEKPLGAELTW